MTVMDSVANKKPANITPTAAASGARRRKNPADWNILALIMLLFPAAGLAGLLLSYLTQAS